MDLIRLDNVALSTETSAHNQYPVDVIAIHGLNGHYERTWTENGTLWLRDLLPEDLPGARVYSFGYDSRIFTDTVMTIGDYALELLNAISRERASDETCGRPLVLVCHSFGGLVAKKALIHAAEDRFFKNTLEMTKAIAFFGTPHAGSLLADRAGPVGHIVKIFNSDTRTDHLKTLRGRETSEELFAIMRSFRFLSEDRLIVSIYETRPTPPINVVIVPRESALTNLPNEIQIPRNADHRSVCKFTSKNDRCYGSLITSLKQLPVLRRMSQVHSLTVDEIECLRTLYVSVYENHKAAVERPVQGTSQWIFTHPFYTRWLEESESVVLWLSGGAGCGKSVISSVVIDALKRRARQEGGSGATICYHFFNDRDNDQREAHFALCAILHQIVSDNPAMICHVTDAYQKKGAQITRDLRTLWNILVELLCDTEAKKVILVFDALDECNKDGKLRILDWIVELINDRMLPTGRLKLFLTSRPEFDIQARLCAPKVKVIWMEDEMQHLKEDIKLVVSSRLNEIGYSKDLRIAVSNQLIDNADGTFLWVALVLRLLKESGDSSHRGVQRVLTGSSRGQNLFSIYAEILDRMPQYQQREAEKALQIIAIAPRPLTLDEFNIAFAIEPDDPYDARLESQLQQNLPRFLLRLGGPFIRIVDGHVHLVHQTAKEFLLDTASSRNNSFRWSVNLVEGNILMARICFWYLRSQRAASLGPDGNGRNGGRDSSKFLSYALTYWPSHFRDGQSAADDETIRNALLTYELSISRELGWFRHYWRGIGFSDEPPSDLTTLTLACISGHDSVIKSILTSKGIPEQHQAARTTYEGTSLVWACRCGHESTAQLLLKEYHFDPNARDADGYTAFWWSTWGGHIGVIELLLSVPSLDVNAADRTGKTPLHIASWLGYDLIAELLLAHAGIDTAARDQKGWTALHWAAWRGRLTVVRQFDSALRGNNGLAAAAASLDNYRCTPLMRACEKGHVDVARLLLPVSNAAAQDKDESTPLSYAAQAGSAQLVEIILADRRGAAVADTPNDCGQTPLYRAAAEGHLAAVQVLLTAAGRSRKLKAVGSRDASGGEGGGGGGGGGENGRRVGIDIDIDSRLCDGQTPLSVAAEHGHLLVVQALALAGASVAGADIDGKTPLWWAAEGGHAPVATYLLDEGADPTTPDRFGKSPLLVATQGGHEDTVRVLLAGRGGDIGSIGFGPTELRRVEKEARARGMREVAEIVHVWERRASAPRLEGGEGGGGDREETLAEEPEETADLEVLTTSGGSRPGLRHTSPDEPGRGRLNFLRRFGSLRLK